MNNKVKLGTVITILIILLAFSISCTHQDKITKIAEYNIISSIDYDNQKCSNTVFGPAGFNAGVRIVLKDVDTGEILKGKIQVETPSFSYGGDYGENYSCLEGLNRTYLVISAYSAGHTPIIFESELQENKMIVVEVPMVKSCSTGGQKILDPIELFNKKQGCDNCEGTHKAIQANAYTRIKQEFDISEEEYNLNCLELDLDRGGFIKATGIYKNNIPFELYHHWGWCSSGGSDCGWTTCFASENADLYQVVKNEICQSLSRYNPSKEVDALIRDCFTDKFEKVAGNKKTFSIVQRLNREEHAVEPGNSFNCLEN